MFPLLESYLFKTLYLFLSIIFAIVFYVVYSSTYWWRKNVPYIKPTIPYGSFKSFLTGRRHITDVTVDLYWKIKKQGLKYSGLYFAYNPVFMPIDLDIIKRILSTDFEYFSDRGVFINPRKDPVSQHLFSLPPEPWKILRAKMTPGFTSGKIRNMFEITHECGMGLIEAMDKKLGKPVEINELTVRYTIDNIGRCAFGIECNSLGDPNERFRKIAERVINPPFWHGIKFLISLISPSIIKYGNMTVMEPAVAKFFLEVVKQNADYRIANNIKRTDFFQILLEMKENDEKLRQNTKMKMTHELMTSQAFVFFAAGFETSSITMTVCLLELSRNFPIQDKVRAEIRKIMKAHGGKFTYDGLKEMVYLEKCVQETMRKHPPLGFLNRECTKRYKVPDTDVVLEKGTKVMISILGIQNDPDYFTDPEKFDPDRFSDTNKDNIKSYTHMPFGEGQRICIGARFGMVQTKLALASLLAHFEFSFNPLTPVPLKFMPQSFVTSLSQGVFLDVKRVPF